MHRIFFIAVLIIVVASCKALFSKKITPEEVVGKYQHIYSQKGIDIPDYIEINTITLNKDYTCKFETNGNSIQSGTNEGTWRISSDTLFMHISTRYDPVNQKYSSVSSNLLYRIRSGKLQFLPYNASNAVYRKIE